MCPTFARRLLSLSVIATAMALPACASEPPPAPVQPVAKPASSSAKTTTTGGDVPTSSVPRAAVHRVVAAGLGSFLQHVVVDEHPVMVGGKFHGFRVAQLTGDPAFWRGVDLKPGDVVTLVNGFPIERPEHALEAFRSLEVASELRVDYERDGQPRVLRYAITDR
jgi:type II secretory pathway component PulC